MKIKKISRKKIVSILISLLVIVAYRILSPSPPTNQNNLSVPTLSTSINVSTQSAVVKRVIDGDTIQLDNNQTVRYIGVDTPELHDPRKPVECFAQEAYEFNKKLVEGKIVRLEKDVLESDKYKRLLRYIYVSNESSPSSETHSTSSGQVFVNLKLVQEGYAYASTFPPDVRYADLFRQAQVEAMKNNKGLWKSCKN